MAEGGLKAVLALGGFERQVGGNRIAERGDLALVSVAVPLGGEAAVERALAAHLSLAMPAPRVSSEADGARAIRSAPDQLMLLLPSAEVAAPLAEVAYLTDQTDGWAMLEIDGPEVLAALERICSIDLNMGPFPVGAAARTVMDYLGVWVIRLGAARFLLMSASSSAASFLHAVETSFDWVVKD